MSSADRHRALLVTMLAVGLVFLAARPIAHAQAPHAMGGQVISRGGAAMGTITFSPLAGGGWAVSLSVRGFDPVAGAHRLAVTDVGHCCPPGLNCAGGAIAVLPEVQFAPDGSATYQTTTAAVTAAALADRDGSAVLLHADARAESEVIGCAVLLPASGAAVPTPAPQPPPGFGPVAKVRAAFGLRLRQAPSLGAPVLTVLPFRAAVFPGAATAVGDGIAWTQVWAVRGDRALIGWVASEFLARSDASSPDASSPGAPPPAPAITLRVVAPAGLRLRAGPGFTFGVRRVAAPGALLRGTGAERVADGEVWAEVEIGGDRLWAARRWLQRL
jgi:hypothetical protein